MMAFHSPFSVLRSRFTILFLSRQRSPPAGGTYYGFERRAPGILDDMSTPQILMCPPDYYGIEYEINPWMSRARGSSPERAQQQWRGLYETLQRLGVQVELMTPQ